jgi:hypothetical protein
MVTVLLIAVILIVFIIGFIDVFKRHSQIVSKIDFASEYRNKFVQLANNYFQDYDRYCRSGTVDNELYVWLTLNVSKMQSNVGNFGVMSYKPAYQNYMINNYQIIINTLPKFREGQIQNFDVVSVDDCLLRYIGYLEDCKRETEKNMKNPIVWFREGFKEIISIPLFILSSFGIFSRRTVESIMDNLIFKILAGLIALVTLFSGLVTIVVGYDQTLKIVMGLIGKQ